MLSEPRAIFFQTELEWPQGDLFHIEKDVIRGLYNKMFEADGYRYPNLDLESSTPTLSKSDATSQSSCRFGSNSITIEERQTSITADMFIEVVETVLGGLKDQQVPPFFLQRCTIHCLSQPNNAENSLVLLAARAARVFEKIEPFERSPSFFGVRFRFGPTIVAPRDDSEANHDGNVTEVVPNVEDSQPATHDSFASMRFETYDKDISQVWMEVAATYFGEMPITLDNIQPVVDNIRNTYQFLAERGKRFLDQFDESGPTVGEENNDT